MYDPVSIVAIVMGGITLMMAIIAFTIVVLVNGRRSQRYGADEARLMQDLHHGFTKMEQRVETLETLLIERETRGRH